MKIRTTVTSEGKLDAYHGPPRVLEPDELEPAMTTTLGDLLRSGATVIVKKAQGINVTYEPLP